MIMSYTGSAFLRVLGLSFCAAGSGQCLSTEVMVIYSIPGMLESYLSDGRAGGRWYVCVCALTPSNTLHPPFAKRHLIKPLIPLHLRAGLTMCSSAQTTTN